MKQHHESCRKASDKEKLQRLKRRAKGKPVDKPEIDCRHGFPRPLVENAHFAEDGSIVLRRLSHWINNFNPYFLAALRCNHDINPCGVLTPTS